MKNSENPAFLKDQLISYLGNKRSIINEILKVICEIKNELKRDKISFVDVFSGSGVVARAAKAHSNLVIANDLESYSRIINLCYLSNFSDELRDQIDQNFKKILSNFNPCESFISELYAPKNDENIGKGERVFFTRKNALIIGGLRKSIEKIDLKFQHFFIAPLLSEASIHSNTGGVFKGFYKDKNGIGKFGGNGENALTRILGEISLKKPIFSKFKSDFEVYQEDALKLASHLSVTDIAYFDPPYNQHPYGSNYFMLNLIANFKAPKIETISEVSGIPNDWNRSNFNKKSKAAEEFFTLLTNFPSKYLIISFNSEGFISENEFLLNLSKIGKVIKHEIKYPTYRASRNLSNRSLYVTEYLYIVKKV